MSWWINFNSLSQKQLQVINTAINSTLKCTWISGFAGTGKTLLLIHIMERLASAYPNTKSCFITYTNSLVDLARTSPIFHRNQKNINVMTHTNFIRNRKKYNFVFLDEIQDITAEDINIISKFADRLFVAGDYDQHIYYNRETYQDDIYDTYEQSDVKKYALNEVFRLTKNICKLAKHIYPDADIVEGLVAAKKNSTINTIKALNKFDEYNWIIEQSAARALTGKPSAILFTKHDKISDFLYTLCNRTHKELVSLPISRNRKYRNEAYDNFNNEAKRAGLYFRFLGSKIGSIDESERNPIVYLTTIHSAKGLDFNNVFIPNLNNNELRNIQNDEEELLLYQRLMLVAVTRSRENLYLSYNGERPQPFINSIPSNIVNRVTLGSGETGTQPFTRSNTSPEILGFDDVDDGDFF